MRGLRKDHHSLMSLNGNVPQPQTFLPLCHDDVCTCADVYAICLTSIFNDTRRIGFAYSVQIVASNPPIVDPMFTSHVPRTKQPYCNIYFHLSSLEINLTNHQYRGMKNDLTTRTPDPKSPA